MDFSEYKDIYVFAEQRDGEIQPVALELIGKAKELAQVTDEKVVAILAGYQIADKAQTLVAYGADKVIVIDDVLLKDYVTEQYTQAVFQAVNAFKPSILMYGATTIGRDLAPRIAARLGTGLTADCTKLTINEETHEFVPTGHVVWTGDLSGTTDIVSPLVIPDGSVSGDAISFEKTAPFFDLQGRRMAQPVKKGLYIHNGKTFVVK